MKSSVSRAPHADANTERDANMERDPPVDRTRLRVLLLEDDLSDAELAERALTGAGLAVSFDRVDTEAAFTAALERGGYDLILSDYNLPSFDGLRALEILGARAAEVPFVLVSGALGEEKAIESMKLGATDYVMKGHLDRLAPVVRRALRDRKAVLREIVVGLVLPGLIEKAEDGRIQPGLRRRQLQQVLQ